jgi:DNA-binding IclR family transcriptional regulator
MRNDSSAAKKTRAAAAGGGVTAVDRALAIVFALEAAAYPLTLAELARETGLYKSTLLRLLASLTRSALVVRRSDQRYSFGPLAFRLGRAYEATYHLRAHVVPWLERLVNDGTESASFHVRQDEVTRLCLFRVNSRHPTLDSVHAGDFLPKHRGAAGKVLIAFDGADALQAKRLDPVAVSYGERDPSCAALACPVFGPDAELYGAISLSGPRERFTPTAVRRMTRLLLDAAAEVTRSLGGVWPWGVRGGAAEPAARSVRTRATGRRVGAS